MIRTDSPVGVGAAARNLLRDFPQFFQVTHAPLTASTIKLIHPLITDLEVRSIEDNSEVEDFSIDARNGVVKFPDVSNIRQGVQMFGYHYEWFLDEDLTYYATVAIDELLFEQSDMNDVSDMNDSEQHLAAIGTLLYALYSLLSEFSTDIDVSTPEGIMIPAHMRFQQVQTLLQFWQHKYDEKASAYNMGPNRISQYTLRRIAPLTNRYVPVFKGREVDDPRWPVRVFPEIPSLGADDDDTDSAGSSGTLVNEFGVVSDGWESIGGSGG